MAETVKIDLRHVARGLPKVSLAQVQAVVELLDEGNTVPFITRYRKDRTGGLDEEAIRLVHANLGKMRALNERKNQILRSLETRAKLTPDLAERIAAAGTTKRLEDIYLPYRPKKTTLATAAKAKGLEPLANEILRGAESCADLDARASEYVNTDEGVAHAADALLGAGHIIAEWFSEDVELRQNLRNLLSKTAKITGAPASEDMIPERSLKKGEPSPPAARTASDAASTTSTEETGSTAETASDAAAATGTDASNPDPAGSSPMDSSKADVNSQNPGAESAAPTGGVPAEEMPVEEIPVEEKSPPSKNELGEDAAATATSPEPTPAESPGEVGIEEAAHAEAAIPAPRDVPAGEGVPGKPSVDSKRKKKSAKAKAQAQRLTKAQLRKQRAREKRIQAFADYFTFSEEIGKIPPHRVLALNRGERAKVLRIGFDYDLAPFEEATYAVAISEGHPHEEFLRGCAKDALVRLLLPSLERELRRELTERAEDHALTVFARNLRNLLLQPPINGRRVLAIDPGFRNGCKLVGLDQFGNILEHDLIFLVGKSHRSSRTKEVVTGLIDRFGLTAVAIGNGSGCRETEEFVSKLISEAYPDGEIAYVIVNEAGASVYSISRIGRDEFPDYDPTLRGAISIGRRLQDPLSELVKIDPASIGVGLYQHDVKAKHLRSSLDEVVESCVNFVGVDVNMASPALLRYVSGLNQLTARHLFEHRMRNGPYRNREEIKNIPGIGQQTFTQAAGFLRITSGDQPLDATWIHPESYRVAEKLLAKIGAVSTDVLDKNKAAELARRLGELDIASVALELEVGEWTLRDLIFQLTRPGRDPRDDLPKPVFKRGVLKLEDLEPGMELSGTVLNVVDFGVFVDIGLHDSGLVHVSHLADRFVRDPHDVVAVGNVVKVWVLEVDKERRRVSLSMIPPGVKDRPARQKRDRGRRGRKDEPPKQQGEKRQQSGRPRHGGKQQRAGRDNRRPKGRDAARRAEYKPRSRPKPVTPITDEMLAGKEAMRTFGDLAQFFAKKQTDGPEDGKDAPDSKESGSPGGS